MGLRTVKQVSSDYGISNRMLRYYEQIGLLESSRKENYAYRVYNEDAVERLQQIIILRKLQIPVRQIREILDNPNAVAVIEIFRQNIEEIDEQITALSTIKSILMRFIDDMSEKADVHLKLDLLNNMVMFGVVSSLSFSENKLKEKATMENLIKADKQLLKSKGVRIVYLPPATVASARCVGDDPESNSDDIMGDFIEDVNLFKIHPSARLYGFNSPDTINDKHIHGYEVWATIPDHLDVPEPLTKKTFNGGLYMAFTMNSGFDDWKMLNEIGRNHEDFEYDAREPFGMGGRLEEHFNSYNLYELKNKEYALSHIDLLLPVKEKPAR